MRKRWGVIGYYGQSNFGDDLFCFVMAKLMEAHGVDYFVQNGRIRARHPISISEVPFLWQWNSDRGPLGKLSRIASNLDATLKATKLVYGGGSVFGQYASFKQRELIRRTATLTNTQLYAFGVSLGPFRDEEDEARYAKLLSRFKAILTRDTESFNFALRNGLNAFDGCDMVWGLPALHKRPINGLRKLLICLHQPVAIRQLAQPELFFQNFDEIHILSLDKESSALNEGLSSEIRKLTNRPVKTSNYLNEDIESIIDEFATASFVITSKLHGAITAAAFEVPFALLEYQPKCTQFVKSIAGYEDFLNHGNEAIFIKNIPKIFDSHWRISFEARKRSDIVHMQFSEMLTK